MKKFLLLLAITCLSLNNAAFGYDLYYIPNTPPYTYIFNVYKEGEADSAFNLPQEYIETLAQSALTWKDVLNVDPVTPVIYAIKTVTDYNAYASSSYVTVEGNPYKITNVNAVLNNHTIITPPAEELPPDGSNGAINIGIGIVEDLPGWQVYEKKLSLYHGDYPDLYSISTHEFMHSLGLASGAQQYKKGDSTYYFSINENDPLTIHDNYLRIYTGNYTAFDPAKEIKPERGMALNAENFDAISYSPYFVGENTLKVLSGQDNADDAKDAIIANGGLINYSDMYYNSENPEASVYMLVFGLPIHPSDNPEKGTYDLSHIELRNSFMSHQDFRNWLIPMEAELAYLKDIGYNIDLRKYFGKSYYMDNLTDTYNEGYSEWDGTSYTANASQVDQGVGIHIYGQNNNITQSTKDIYSTGNGVFGVRIDGVQNQYTLDGSANIITSGNDSIGLGATWGKNHTVNIYSGSTVSASGENGIAVSFDFGNNLFGRNADIRGSYINFSSDEKKNLSPEFETQGALIENFNTTGTLTGAKAAIYISDNAFVKNINIGNTSVINGNIISEWNSVFSGKANILRKNDYNECVAVNKDNIDEIYFTNLNFSGTTTVNGNIDGSNDIFNTLKMDNSGLLNFNGNEFGVYSLNNTGTINFINTTNPLALSIQNSSIKGNGDLYFNNGVNFSYVNYIENTVNINDTYISLLNGSENRINISKLNSDNAGLYIDMGDRFVLQNNSDSLLNQLTLKQIAVSSKYTENIDSIEKIKLFEEKDLETIITLDVNSDANFYYNNNKYTFSQDNSDKSYLTISKTTGNYELADAIADSSTGNYIVTETDTFTKNLGTINGEYFDISGEDIDLKGNYNGLVVDGNYNIKTTLKTDIKGAQDSNITLQNKGFLFIDSKDDEITIANKGETALKMDNSSLEIAAEKNSVTFAGKVQGLNLNTDNKIVLNGNEVNFNEVDNVLISSEAEMLNLNNTSIYTVWQITEGNFNVLKDEYLSSDGTNELIVDGGNLNLMNNNAGNIALSKMTLNNDLSTSIDIDLKSMQSDRFVFSYSNNLETNGNGVIIKNVNILNSNTALEKDSYLIPFISSDYNNQNLLNLNEFKDSREIMTPIFKYNLGYSSNNNQEGFVLSRGSSSDYKSYNPSILASTYAAQLGGYFNQLNSYNAGFSNMDMTMLMTKEERTAMKYRNKIAASNGVLTYDPNQLMQENKSAWFRPYSVFEKVNVSNGGRVENTSYGSYFGGDSEIIGLKHGWDAQYSIFLGYNGSHQNYDNVSIYQNGGQLGASGYFYKGNFFTGLTASVGASNAQTSTIYGNEDFTMLSTGIASKTGYNLELAKGKFIIQPNYLMSYSFVNTFDYTNAAGVSITSDPLHAIQIAPGIKFIGNLKNGWQPYLGVTMIWNIMDKTNFMANNVSLPQMSIDPYIQYGIGLKKKWKDRFTGFAQAMITNGGRNGVALTAGFSWSLGK